MQLNRSAIQAICTDAVFERGQTYSEEGRIQRLDRFGDLVTATVQGSSRYDVTVDLEDELSDAHCTCPYDGPKQCKHIVAVLLEVAAGSLPDERNRLEAILDDIPADDLRTFICEACAEHPELHDRVLARFGREPKSVEEYRSDIEQLFDQHTQEYPVVTDAIDFSHFVDLAEQYSERGRYLAAATVYRALFETVDDNYALVDAAYDHYATTLQSALDGYIECVLAADPDDDTFESLARVLEEQATAEPPINSEQFWRALDELEDRRG